MAAELGGGTQRQLEKHLEIAGDLVRLSTKDLSA